MKKLFIVVIILAMFTIAIGAAANPIRVLYVTQCKGFKHAVLHESETILEDLGVKNGFDVKLTHLAEQVINPKELANTDVIIFYTTGELPLSATQKTALLDFVKSGKGFIGIHSATDTFYQWPEYGEMINGYFDGHPWTQDVDVTIKVNDRTHPTTSHMPETISMKEEIYQFKQFAPDKVKVLVSLDTTKTDMTRQGIKASSFPLVWYKQYGKGRVYYNALGHRPDVWNADWYKTMMVNTIKWAAGQTK